MNRDPDSHDLLVAFLLVQSLLERQSEALFQPFDLTGAKFNILNLLASRGGKMDQAALVDLLLVGKSSTSIVIGRMVREGLIKREEHAKDRRRTVLILTSKGRSLWQKVAPSYHASVKKVFGALSLRDRQSFFKNLKVVHDGLKEDAEPDSFESRVFNPGPRDEMV